MRQCKNCQWFYQKIPSEFGEGECRFFPKPVKKFPRNWCGQFKDKRINEY